MAKRCQSCGMPLEKDPGKGGTHADGTKSTEYCSLCFVGGHFSNPKFNAIDMQDFCIEKMRERGIPRFVGWFLTRDIPKLDRWHPH